MISRAVDEKVEAKADETWECKICTLINSTADLRCEACETPRPQFVAEAGLASEESEEEDNVTDKATVWGAAGAGAGLGFVLGGGLFAAVGAAGGAFAATREGKVGDVARTSGRGVVKLQQQVVALNEKHKVTSRVQAAAADAVQKTKELNEKHQITQRAQTAATGVVNGAKSLNEKHQILSRAWNVVKGGVQKAKEFDERHQVSTHVAQAAGAGLSSLERTLAPQSAARNAAVADIAEPGPEVTRGVLVSPCDHPAAGAQRPGPHFDLTSEHPVRMLVWGSTGLRVAGLPLSRHRLNSKSQRNAARSGPARIRMNQVLSGASEWYGKHHK
eukprot:CAMPEP_0196735630 /NCGR_PEP_ID=MMETSP1091-20130531/13998_1 /TAXON_ID=302021 /ORGANISM="Rhodomonas sp., Strain CCMP768" /LENGTH=330 /DNA_ID=CAMNT_0042079285 /DNA_START=20 /DNA_END=1010 /DNA_ORIENTATION=-